MMVSDVPLADGRRVRTHPEIAPQVRGLDADGDLVVPLGSADAPIRHDDGSEWLVPLTPCCHATGKGWADGDGTGGVVCRTCFEWVDEKFGGPTTVAVPRSTEHGA